MLHLLEFLRTSRRRQSSAEDREEAGTLLRARRVTLCPQVFSGSCRDFMTAQVSIIYFGQSAELTGLKEEEPVSVPTPISSRELWELLQQRHPRLAALRGHVVLAVSQQYVPVAEQLVVLRDGDEVAVVPPLSGG
uniref:Molybdopterin synthase sulfur carrier subunit-like n=2 Tax=Oryzias melastigma TaxID=30732 RepID=A0A3B3D5E8_ORYME